MNLDIRNLDLKQTCAFLSPVSLFFVSISEKLFLVQLEIAIYSNFYLINLEKNEFFRLAQTWTCGV